MSDQLSESDRLQSLTAALRAVEQRCDALEARVRILEVHEPLALTEAEEATASAPAIGGVGGLSHHSGAMRRVATITFILVAALVLRTFTDSGIVDTTLGVWLGVGYALLLLAEGWRRFAGGHTGRRVFTVCGTLLLCSLVLETHGRFDLPSVAAHALLVIALVASATLGLRYRSPITVELGVVTAAAAVIAVGFPRPDFPVTAGTLVLAMILATQSTGRRVTWLPSVVFALQLFFWLLWTVTLRAAIAHGGELPADLVPAAFTPTLALTGVSLLVIAWLTRDRGTTFTAMLPTANVVVVVAAATAVSGADAGYARLLGGACLLAAATHALFAMRCTKDASRSDAAVHFATAGFVALVPGLWLSTSALWLVLPLVSASALGAAVWSHRLVSGGLRALAVLAQVATAATAAIAGCYSAPSESPWFWMTVGASLATLTIVHGRWTHRVPPPAGSLYARLTPSDVAGHALFWSATATTFGVLRVGLHPLLSQFVTEVDATYQAAQSVLLNTMAIALFAAAMRTHHRDLLRRAVAVAAIGGLKVFADDFLTLRGVPLVTAVFSFGVAAAVGSLVLGRWPREAASPS